MSEAKHTPGSWSAERCEVTPCFHIDAGAYPFGTSVCVVTENPRVGSAQANARLIAAAPDLLAALEAIVAFEAGPDFSIWAKRIEAARATITKATAP